MKYKILGVIQARGGSKGIPKKNIYNIAGHPLISYTIDAGLRSGLITDLIVSTDSEEIAEISRRYGARVPFMRPAELAGDKVVSVDSLKHAVLETEKILCKQYDYIVELPCVSPLRDNGDIDGALEKLINDGCDSVISMVCTGEKHPTRLKKIINGLIVDMTTEYPEPPSGSRRQDLTPEAYIRNGAIYAMTRNTLVNNHSRHGVDSRPYIMQPEKSVNIDTVFDLEMAEFLILKGKCNNKPKIKFNLLITTPLNFMTDVEKKYNDLAYCTIMRSDSSLKDIKSALSYANGWVCHPCPKYKIDKSVLENTNLKFIASTSTGTNHIDVDYCAENNIKVLSLKNNSKISTIKASSEFTFGLMLSVVRKIPQSFNSVKMGNWRENENEFRSIELSGKTLGIIGYGRIGSNNARYGLAFGMKVLAFDPYVNINDAGVKQEQLASEVLAKSDIVMICVHLTPETKNMVSGDWFHMMKPGVVFINTSRGEVIDEESLLDNLKSFKVSAAGLDVLSNEASLGKNPHPIIEYAKQNDNLIITSHIAGLTHDSEKKAAEIILEQIKELI